MSSLKLEEGKFYRSRAGQKVGPVRYRGGGCSYPWDLSDDTDETWTDDGRFDANYEDVRDLVAEWVDEPAAPCCAPGGDGCPDCTDAGSDDRIGQWLNRTPEGLGERTWTFNDQRPPRVKILHDGAALTNGDRDDEYGPPANNMTCAGELKAVFRKWLARDISPGELEALDMAMTKLSRMSCGKPKRDTYVDAATYIAIAGEIALAPTA